MILELTRRRKKMLRTHCMAISTPVLAHDSRKSRYLKALSSLRKLMSKLKSLKGVLGVSRGRNHQSRSLCNLDSFSFVVSARPDAHIQSVFACCTTSFDEDQEFPMKISSSEIIIVHIHSR
eukprot:m.787066 g.787066  ORF g.787066 m.787066 type:complete len:121 (+) comp59187_c0_seq3:1454-1816(+)